MKLLRGYLALITTCLGMLLADLVQRFMIGPFLWLRPQSRHSVLGHWLQGLAWLVTRPLEVIGGASIPNPERVVPCEPGTLIVMNHQSMLDIPLAVQAVQSGGYLSVVTRRRYTRWIPLISHLIRLYQYPAVDPTANAAESRRMLKQLRKVARESEVPILIYPEGTRTKTGDIGPFRPGGMNLILRTRPWKVYVLVVDGIWEHAKFKHLIGSMDTIASRVDYLGCFEWTDPKGDSEAFIADIRQQMIDHLEQMRGAAVA